MTTDSARVARIITRLNIGGPSRHVGILNVELPKLGFGSELLVGKEMPTEGFLAVGGAVKEISGLQRQISPVHDLKAYRQLRDHLEKSKPHVVHTHMAKAGALGRIAAYRTGVPAIVHTFHGHVLQGYFSPHVQRAFVRTERWLAVRSTALIAVSSAVRDDLLALGIGKQSQWHVISEIPDLDDLFALPPREPDETFTVGIVGRLTAIKDHRSFLDAMSLVLEAHPTSRFIVVGDGELRGELERLAEPFGPSITFTGWVQDLASIYRGLDVVVLTSQNEGAPLALMEASAAAISVVATDVGGVSDVVKDEETGFLVAAGDVPAIADRVLRLAGSHELRRRFGEAGRDWVRNQFSSQRLVREVADLYTEVLSRNKRQP